MTSHAVMIEGEWAVVGSEDVRLAAELWPVEDLAHVRFRPQASAAIDVKCAEIDVKCET